MTVRKAKVTPRLFFDIETVVNPKAIKLLPDPKIDKRIKDPDKIAAAKEEKLADTIEMAPLDPDLAMVTLISMQIGMDGEPMFPHVMKKGPNKMTEAQVIKEFWKYFALCNGCAVGYNVLSFDLPFLLRRSMDLSITPAIAPNLAKYKNEPITDLYGILYNWSWEKSKGLKWLAKRYNIEVLAPEVDGSMVKDMTEEELLLYGASDLHVTVELYRKMNGIYFYHLQQDGDR
jgi:hypothetical protein